MRFIALAFCVAFISIGPALAEGRDDAAQQLLVRRLDAAEAVAPSGRAALPSGCISGALPTAPPSDAVVQAAIGQSWLSVGGYALNYTVKHWRQACSNDPSKSAVLARYSFTSGKVWVCGAGWKAIQGARTFSSVRLKTSGSSVSSQCDYIYTDQTFVLDQWSVYDNFDEQAAFAYVIDDYGYSIGNASIPAYSGGSSPTPATPSTGMTPVAGWWWNAAQAGRGWGIGMNGTDRIFLGGFFYSASAGAPATWAVATMTRMSSGSNTFAGSLQYCTGGQALEATSAASPACSAGGDATITLSSTRTARLTITRPFGVTSIDIVPFDQF